jgi:hypothetical protein
MYYSLRSFVQRKMTPFPAQISQDPASSKSGLSRPRVRAVRIALSRLFFSIKTTKGNKNQQLRLGPDWSRHNKHQQKSTKYQQSQQKSAKVSKIIAGPRAQSAKVSKSQQKSASVNEHSQQKSAKIITNHQKSSPVWTIIIKNHQ